MSFAASGFARFARSTKRANFLSEMDRIVPWERLCAVVAPHYSTGEGGRQAIALERMLRIYFLQQWFNLGDPTVEEARDDSRAMEAFAKIDLGREPVPDETTICKFGHLLERHGLGPALRKEVNAHLAEHAAPSSTKNASGKRDPEMHQTMTGNQWPFGMKAHIGMDSKLEDRPLVACNACQRPRQPPSL